MLAILESRRSGLVAPVLLALLAVCSPTRLWAGEGGDCLENLPHCTGGAICGGSCCNSVADCFVNCHCRINIVCDWTQGGPYGCCYSDYVSNSACEDGDPCTYNSCFDDEGCHAEPPADCDDDDPCTDDSCGVDSNGGFIGCQHDDNPCCIDPCSAACDSYNAKCTARCEGTTDVCCDTPCAVECHDYMAKCEECSGTTPECCEDACSAECDSEIAKCQADCPGANPECCEEDLCDKVCGNPCLVPLCTNYCDEECYSPCDDHDPCTQDCCLPATGCAIYRAARGCDPKFFLDGAGFPGQEVLMRARICNDDNCAESYTLTAVKTAGQAVVDAIILPSSIGIPGKGCTEFDVGVRLNAACGNRGHADILLTATSQSEGTCEAPETRLCTISARVTVIQVDLDVDSNNDGNIDVNDSNAGTDDPIEVATGLPGLYVPINDDDEDEDGRKDFGDGFNLDGEGGNADDTNAYEGDFFYLLFEVPAEVDLSVARVMVSYEASDPMTAFLSTGTPRLCTPAPGRLRIWRDTDAPSRLPARVDHNPPGDYVGVGDYAPSHLGLSDGHRNISLMIEGIRASTAAGSDRIEFKVDPDGPGPQGFSLCDRVHLTVIGIDVDVDSDNTKGNANPNQNALEDEIEDFLGSPTLPGKFIRVNRDNDDDPPGYADTATLHERIDDFGDGFNADGAANNEDDVNADENDFIPLVVELSDAIDPVRATIHFTYVGSDPAGLTFSDATTGHVPPGRREITPDAGAVRIWTKVGTVARNSAGIGSSGDYVTPNATVPVSRIGITAGNQRTVLYVEGVAPSASLGATRLQVQIDPDGIGPAGFVHSDAVRFTCVDVRFSETSASNGFDRTINPNGLMVPLSQSGTGIAKNVNMHIAPNAPIRFRTTTGVATVASGPFSGDGLLAVTSVAVGDSMVQAFVDTPDELVVGQLRVQVLPQMSPGR